MIKIFMRLKSRYIYLFAFIILFSSAGCGVVEKVALKSTGSVLKYGVQSLYEEEDLAMAESAIMADLKLLEGLIIGSPKNKNFLCLAAQGFTGYALGFAEDEDPQRAKIFYNRAKDYGLKSLKRDKAFRNALNGNNIDDLAKALKKMGKPYVPTLFWTANAWGSWINLSRDSPKAIAEMGKVELIMQRVIELDETYYYGGSHLFFASFYGGRSKMFGGDPEKAKNHFDRFVELSEGKFLMGYVLFARYYAIQMQDRELYKSLLVKVLDTPGNVLAEQRLVNEIAKIKAAKLLKDIEDYF